MKRWCKHSGKEITRDWEECDDCLNYKTVRCSEWRPHPRVLAVVSFMDWFERIKTNEGMLPAGEGQSESCGEIQSCQESAKTEVTE